ncbi:MAG TPA: hypothetical protein VHO47_00890 [Candidatus Babeliales bacterium]|nr:hypothetical protein [Candidatus Babeliales bacterium]
MEIKYIFSIIIITSCCHVIFSAPYQISLQAGKPALTLSEGDVFVDSHEKKRYEIVSIEDCQSQEGTRFLVCRLIDSNLSLHKKYTQIEQGPNTITSIKPVDSIEAFMSRYIELNLRKNYTAEKFIIKGVPYTLTEVKLDEKTLDRTRPGDEDKKKEEIKEIQSKRLFPKDKFIRADYLRTRFFYDDRVIQFASNNPPSNYETVSERYDRNYRWKRIIPTVLAVTVIATAAYSFFRKIKRTID